MITIKPKNKEAIMEVIVNGKITTEDIEEFEMIFKEKKENYGKINLLMEVHEIQGYSMNAVMEDLKFSANHWKEFNKIAVITDKKWIGLGSKISNILPGVEVKHFDFDEKEKALYWLE
ncbi:STAS/SEC14 domain-containing protein [Evansella sp. AB-P1]|uniref:STAS/SEC14 domain-containing protein n=1 Tax=Evansella sp. AB-P1 TaxID=3037653 RepID=UPI00241DA9F1|nr:STAS/SEC14 domain-containing protein [Evansella sp. AB-P1]MDG5786798.1 STAS/SEC14 domain-containing protein [Evansella sp. AB-P1]